MFKPNFVARWRTSFDTKLTHNYCRWSTTWGWLPS